LTWQLFGLFFEKFGTFFISSGHPVRDKEKSFITPKLDRDDVADSGKGWPSSSSLPGLARLY